MFKHTITAMTFKSWDLMRNNIPGAIGSVIDHNMGSEYIITVHNNKNNKEMENELCNAEYAFDDIKTVSV